MPIPNKNNNIVKLQSKGRGKKNGKITSYARKSRNSWFHEVKSNNY